MISDIAKAKTLPDEAVMASLEKPVMDGTVDTIEDIRDHV